MKYSENLNLKLPEGGDTLEVSDLSENFETLDGAVGEAVKNAAPYKVGDTLTTWRTDLGENWLLCNGQQLKKEDYPELYQVSPKINANLADNQVYELGTSKPITAKKTSRVYVNGTQAVRILNIDNLSLSAQVFNYLSNEEIIINIGSLTVYNDNINYDYGVFRDDTFYVFIYYSTGSSNWKYCCARCIGDLTVPENWKLFTYNGGAYTNIFNVSFHENYILFSGGSSSDLTKAHFLENEGVLFFDNSVSVGRIPADNASINLTTYPNLFVFKNKFYTIYANGTGYASWIYVYRLSIDESVSTASWELVHSQKIYDGNIFSTNKTTTVVVQEDIVMCTILSSYTSSKITAGWYVTIDNNEQVTVEAWDNIVLGVPGIKLNTPFIRYNNAHYFCLDSNDSSKTILARYDELSPEALADPQPTTYTLSAAAVSTTANYYNLYIANGKDYALFLPKTGQNLKILFVPNFSTPKISQSTTYTYIKAKEDTPNANQQADTPAS